MIDLAQAELIAKILEKSVIKEDGRIDRPMFEHYMQAQYDAIKIFPGLVRELKSCRGIA